MKRLSLVILVACCGTLLIQSCKSGGSNVPVPTDAAFVMHINNGSFSSKLSWQEIKATNWFKEAHRGASDSLLGKLMDDPDNSGMDTKADMMLFVKQQGRANIMVFEGSVKDATAFEAFNKKVSEGGTVSKAGDVSIMKMKDHGIASWKGNRFAYAIDVPFSDGINSLRGGNNAAPYKLPMDSLQQFAVSTYGISGKNSLGSDERFSALLKEAGDIHIWINNEQYLSALSGDMLGMLKVADLFKGNVSANTISFDNGKITMKGKQYLNDQLAALYKKFPPKKISAEVINRIPSQNVVGVLAMNYSPEGLKELIKLTGMDGMANGFLEKAGYSIDEFVKANKGDLIVAVSDLQINQQEVSMPGMDGEKPSKYTQTKPDVKVLFATSVNDKAAFDKLITTLSGELGEEKNMLPDINYQVDKNWFVAGNSADYVSKFLSGNGTKQPFTAKLTDQSFGMYVDIQKIMTSTQNSIKDNEAKQAMDLSLKMWQDIIVTGGDFKDGAFTSYAEINMVDKGTNSLKLLNQYLDKMAGLYKSQKGNRMSIEENPFNADSTTVTPAK